MLAQQRTELSDALEGANSAEQHHARVRRELEAEYRRAAGDLGVALLPALDAPSLTRAIQLTGYSPFQHEDPIAARDTARRQLEEHLAVIENDPSFRDRELHRHPRTGTLIVRMKELSEHRQPWADVLEAAARRSPRSTPSFSTFSVNSRPVSTSRRVTGSSRDSFTRSTASTSRARGNVSSSTSSGSSRSGSTRASRAHPMSSSSTCVRAASGRRVAISTRWCRSTPGS